MKTTTSIIIFLLILAKFSFCQDETITNPIDSPNKTSIDTLDYYIPVLDVIIDSALVNSPILQNDLFEVEKNEQQLKITNKRWMNYIYVDGNMSYGMYNQIILNDNAVSDLNTGIVSQSESAVYYGGLSMKIPLSELGSRGNEKEIIKLEIKKANLEYEIAREDLIQLITLEYYTLLYLEQSTKAFRDVVQTLNISYLKALKDIENGKMELDEFALLVSTRGKAIDQYLKTKNNFYAQYKKLQSLSGYSF